LPFTPAEEVGPIRPSRTFPPNDYGLFGRLSGRTRHDTGSSAAELGQYLIRGNHLAALSVFVAAGYCCMEMRALVLVQIITVVNNGEIDLGPFGSVVGFIQLQPTLVNLRFELQHNL